MLNTDILFLSTVTIRGELLKILITAWNVLKKKPGWL